MLNPLTVMHQEALQASNMLRTQLANVHQIAEISSQIRALMPHIFISVARGSSDHAAHFFSYLVMQKLGIFTVSMPPSLVTLHQSALHASHSVAFGFSQSGASPDLIGSIKHLGACGAKTVACVNQDDSLLAQSADWVLPIHAGPELSVAATKSCLGIMTLAAQFVALWQEDHSLMAEISELIEHFAHVNQNTLEDALPIFGTANRVMMIGRGLSFSVALEAALKMKETCAIQSEAFSVAEVRHGPMRLIEANYAVIVFITPGPEQAQLVEFAIEMHRRNAHILAICATDQQTMKTLQASGIMTLNAVVQGTPLSPTLAPIAALQRFYIFLSQLSLYRGLDPDNPLFLNKITQTH